MPHCTLSLPSSPHFFASLSLRALGARRARIHGDLARDVGWRLGVQRHGQDLADRLAQGFSRLFQAQPPQIPWSPALPPKLTPFDIDFPVVPFVGGGRAARIGLPPAAVASFVEISGRLGQAGSDLGACVGGRRAAARAEDAGSVPRGGRTAPEVGGDSVAAAAAAYGRCRGSSSHGRAAAAAAPPSAQVVGSAFVQQYYHVLHQSPDLVHRFYQDASRLGRPSAGGSGDMDSVTTMEAMNEKIMAMDMARAEIRTVDSQESLGGGVTVLVTGHLTGGDGVRREFSQSFLLAPQEKGYFVLNDMFRYVGEDPAPAAAEVQPEADAVVPTVAAPLANGTAGAAVEPAAPEHGAVPQQEQHVAEHTPVQPEEEVYNPPPEDVQEAAVDEEQPVPEVIDEIPNNVAMTTTVAPLSHVEAPKKSYASIVRVMKETPLPAPAPLARPAPPKPEKQPPAHPATAPAADVPPFSSNPESSNIQEPEVDAHAIYVRNLPLNATPPQLADEFKKFGTVKHNGIQVRSHKAGSVVIGGRQCYIEEKRTPGSRGSSRGRFAPGRGNNFRTEGMRGRGNNYNGGRSYGRGDFGYRSDYGGRSGGRGGSGRGADAGYQRVDHSGHGGRTSASTGPPAK